MRFSYYDYEKYADHYEEDIGSSQVSFSLLKKSKSPGNLFTHFPSSQPPLPSSPLFDHLAFCARLRHRAQRPQETLSTFLNALKPSLGHSSSASPAAHKAPGGQIWAHFRHWTGWIKPGFGPKFISRNFIEISTNSSDSMLPWKKGGSFFSSSCNILPGKHLRVHQQCQKNPVI